MLTPVVGTPVEIPSTRLFAALRMTQKKQRVEFGIWTLTRRIEDDASASPCQGEAQRWTPGSLRSADSGRDDTKKGAVALEFRALLLASSLYDGVGNGEVGGECGRPTSFWARQRPSLSKDPHTD